LAGLTGLAFGVFLTTAALAVCVFAFALFTGTSFLAVQRQKATAPTLLGRLGSELSRGMRYGPGRTPRSLSWDFDRSARPYIPTVQRALGEG
jgi:hypothetical protein